MVTAITTDDYIHVNKFAIRRKFQQRVHRYFTIQAQTAVTAMTIIYNDYHLRYGTSYLFCNWTICIRKNQSF